MIDLMSKCIQGASDPLSTEAIDALIDQLYMDTLVRAEYLFVSDAGSRHLIEAIIRRQVRWESSIGRYRGMHVVILPTLPAETFLVGVLQLAKETPHD